MAITPLNLLLQTPSQSGSPNRVERDLTPGLTPFETVLAQQDAAAARADRASRVRLSEQIRSLDRDEARESSLDASSTLGVALPRFPPPATPTPRVETADRTREQPVGLQTGTSQFEQLRLQNSLATDNAGVRTPAEISREQQRFENATGAPAVSQAVSQAVSDQSAATRATETPAEATRATQQAANLVATPAVAAAPPQVGTTTETVAPNPVVNPSTVPTAGQLVIVPPQIPASSLPLGTPLGLADSPFPMPVAEGAAVSLDVATSATARQAAVFGEQATQAGSLLAPSGGAAASSFAANLAAATSAASGPGGDALSSVARPVGDNPAEIRANVIPPGATAPTLLATEPRAAIGTAAPQGATAPVVQQLADGFVTHARALSANGRTEFQLQLDPQNLGQVRIHLTATGDEIRGHLFVADDATRRMIESQLPELRQRLESAGVAVQQFDVSTGSPGSQAGGPWHGGQLPTQGAGSSRPAAGSTRAPEAAGTRSAHRIDVTV